MAETDGVGSRGTPTVRLGVRLSHASFDFAQNKPIELIGGASPPARRLGGSAA